jgi:hypothetical protein
MLCVFLTDELSLMLMHTPHFSDCPSVDGLWWLVEKTMNSFGQWQLILMLNFVGG